MYNVNLFKYPIASRLSVLYFIYILFSYK
ncbi:hypothetical protein M140OLGA_2080 [Staphylococcus aureus subsp. aureus 112808A]|nr:hypothetical protein M140OLGA_2080 [Staphylococcus aureus subsp. aureus 112808A]